MSLIHLLEFARRERKERRRGVTRFIDEVAATHGITWVKLRHEVELAEAWSEFLRTVGVDPEPWEVYADSIVDAIPHEVDLHRATMWRHESIESQVEDLRLSPTYARDYDTFRKQEHPGFLDPGYTLRLPVDRAMAYFPATFRTPGGLLVNLTREMREQFAASFEIGRCPAMQFVHAYNTAWKRGGSADPRDLEDLFHLVSAAYCDVAFVDNHTRDLLRQGGVPQNRLPYANGDIETWMRTDT